MQMLVSDSKSNSLINLFENNKQQQEQSSVRSHIMYQLHANNTIGYDEHTYRIDYVCYFNYFSFFILKKRIIKTFIYYLMYNK